MNPRTLWFFALLIAVAHLKCVMAHGAELRAEVLAHQGWTLTDDDPLSQQFNDPHCGHESGCLCEGATLASAPRLTDPCSSRSDSGSCILSVSDSMLDGSWSYYLAARDCYPKITRATSRRDELPIGLPGLSGSQRCLRLESLLL